MLDFVKPSPIGTTWGQFLSFKQYRLVDNIGLHNVQFQKKSVPLHGWSPEIPRGRGFLKVKILEAKYKAKLEFPEEGGGGGGQGVQNQILPCGEHGCFLELHNV